MSQGDYIWVTSGPRTPLVGARILFLSPLTQQKWYSFLCLDFGNVRGLRGHLPDVCHSRCLSHPSSSHLNKWHSNPPNHCALMSWCHPSPSLSLILHIYQFLTLLSPHHAFNPSPPPHRPRLRDHPHPSLWLAWKTGTVYSLVSVLCRSAPIPKCSPPVSRGSI